ncbi:MAG: MerR family transcriptional regulator [Actinomycetes bacterium]
MSKDPKGDGALSDPKTVFTIGTVCERLSREFPDLTISKIRYLEDRGLLTPRRTAGGYRMYGRSEVDRLRTILRLQRDEFLPLKVIRQELASGRTQGPEAAGQAAPSSPRRTATAVQRNGSWTSIEDVILETGVEASLVKELQEYGVIKSEAREGTAGFDDTDIEIIKAVGELARYGVAGRNLRVFRSSADRESALLQQILAPALRSRNAERRAEAVEALDNLASVTSYLGHLLLVRDLRKLAGTS